ncbi:hypothetical protein [Eubacterium ramulus]
MKKPGSRNRKNKKKIAGALAGVGIVALFLALMISFGKTAPENPMDKNRADASRMYLLSSTLDMDMDQLANIGNANINAGDSKNQAEQEDQQQEEEQQEQNQDTPQQEQQQNQDTQNPNQDQNTSDPNIQDTVAANIPGSLMNLIQKNQTGGSGNGSSDQPGDGQGDGPNNGTTGGNSGIPSDGGQQTTLNPSQSAALFTTSLKDGDEVTDPEYPFTVDLTEKGKQLTLVSITVNLNGSGRICKSRDSLTLKEGANSVYVTVRFRDSKYNQIDASTKVYTIYYYPENEVQLVVRNARTGEYINDQDALTVMQDTLWIEVRARKASHGVISDVAARVRLNNRTQNSDSDGIYRMGLTLGNNQLKVTAGEGGNTQKTLSCTVNYKIDNFMISFESSIRTEKISNNPGIGDKVFKGITKLKYASTSADFSFRVRNSTVTGVEKIDKIQMTNRYGTLDITDLAGADGYISITLDASRSTDIKVYCTDSDGESQWYTWSITYERVLDPAENQKNAPVIRADVTNETVNKNPFIIPIKVFDHNGNELKANENFTLYLNGEYQDYHSRQQDGTYEYNLVLTEGPNTVVIKAVDNEGYTAEKTLTVTYNPVAEEARVRVIVSGEVVGLGTMIDETITAKSDQTVAEIVEARLAAHGYSTIHDGVANADSYFLRHVMKPGIATGWSISSEERSLLDMLGYDLTEGPRSVDSLGEKDFTAGSGWMVTLNHYYIAQTMGTRPIRDGDEIHLIYTLSVGKDIGVDTSSSIYD